MTKKELRKFDEGRRLAGWYYTDDRKGYLRAKRDYLDGEKQLRARKYISDTYWAAKYYLTKIGEL